MFAIYWAYCHEYDNTWSTEPSVTPYNLIIFVTQGELRYVVNDVTVDLKRSDVLFIPEQSVRSGTSLRNTRHQRYTTHFLTDSADIRLPILEVHDCAKVTLQNHDYFKQRFSLLNQQWGTKAPHYEIHCDAILLEMLVLLNREMSRQSISSKKVAQVAELKNFIFHHYREPIRISDLADLIDRTPNYVTRIFREVSGQTPIQYLHYVRISYAKELILNTSMTLSQISDFLGFCDQFYFQKVFKKIIGMSPSGLLKDRETL